MARRKAKRKAAPRRKARRAPSRRTSRRGSKGFLSLPKIQPKHTKHAKVILPILGVGGIIAYFATHGSKAPIQDAATVATPEITDTASDTSASTPLAAALAATTSTPPAGGSSSLADLADQVAADIQANGPGYNHTLLASFQRAAGIHVDGLYGPESASALSQYTDAPPPFAQYTPSSTAIATQGISAREFGVGDFASPAELVHAIRYTTNPMFRRKMVAAFQRGEGLTVHGWLDPETQAAMARYAA